MDLDSGSLIPPVSQLKRGSDICPDRARVKCCARTAQVLRRKNLCSVKAVAKPAMSVRGKWDVCQCGSAFAVCLIKTRRFSRLGSGLLTKCTSSGGKFRRREL